MFYFFLAIIVFIAQLFPEPQAKALGQQEGGRKERSRWAGKSRHGDANVGSKSSTPKPASYKTATARAPSGSHDLIESAGALGYNDISIGKCAVDVSTQTQRSAISSGNVTDISEPKEDVRVVMVDASTQTGHFAASKIQPWHTSSSETSSHVGGGGLVNNDSRDTLASEGGPGKWQSGVEEKTSDDDFADSSPSSNFISDATLVDDPSGSPSRSMMHQGPSEESHAPINALAAANRTYISSGQRSPVEKAGSALQDAGETISAVEPSAVVLEQLVVTEKAAHQQTREELSRLEGWCKHLEAENTELQTRAEDAERENARIQRRLVIVEDEIVGYQTEVTNAQGQIRNLMNSNEIYISTIEALRRQEVSLNGEIAWYLQLGIDFYGRLQKAERFLNPHDKVFAYYQRLISDAAQYFSIPMEAGDGNEEVHDHAVRVEEIDDTGHSEGGEDDQESGDFPIFDISNITSDHMPTNEADAGKAEAHVAAIDDDEVPCADRPMRPGTANRVPISVFAANNGDASTGPSSSMDVDSSPRASPSAPPASSTIFSFSDNLANPKKNLGATAASEPAPNTKASKTSARNRTGRGGINSSRGSRSHGTYRSRGSPLGGGDEDDFDGEAVSNTSCEVDSSPPATAFPINFGFAETSLKTGGKREANSRPVFGH